MKPGTKPLHATFAVAAWCVAYAIEHAGNSPSIEEIAAHFGVQKSTAAKAMNRMYRYGIARREDGKLIICGGGYVPPQWYIDNVHPTLSRRDLTEESRHTTPIMPVTTQR